MNKSEIFRAWGGILMGRRPSLSIEITRECPLRCPGCYAYEDAHLGGEITLRQLVDSKGNELVQGILNLVDRYRPLHVSLVGGDPLVRYRELEILLPKLSARGIYVQVVTSAFRGMDQSWATLPRLTVVVSIDGLQPDHDLRRKPATYERILANIAGQRITVHCTITGQMVRRAGSLEEFLRFWTQRPEIHRVWMSMFTPQKGDHSPECLSVAERDQAVSELLRLKPLFPKLDMANAAIREFSKPPDSPAQCIFAQTTHTLSADLKTKIVPCQFGGDPDCSRCGCIASMSLAVIGNHRLGGWIPVSALFRGSARIGDAVSRLRPN